VRREEKRRQSHQTSFLYSIHFVQQVCFPFKRPTLKHYLARRQVIIPTGVQKERCPLRTYSLVFLELVGVRSALITKRRKIIRIRSKV
jgi:hypothetical protein